MNFNNPSVLSDSLKTAPPTGLLPSASSAPLTTSLPSSPFASRASSIAFIDASVSDYQMLMAGIAPGTEVHILNSSQDAVTQITNTLLGRHNISSLHIVSHGEAGGLDFGTGKLNLSDLPEYAAQLQSWSKALTNDADILLYGCNVAQGELGKAFTSILSQLTGADVAASTNLTGNSDRGGDWNLEYHYGDIKADQIFTSQSESAYQGVLANFTVTNTNDSGSGSLRDAINQANTLAGADTINFDPTTFSTAQTIRLQSQLLVNDSVSIQGPGQNLLTISGDANNNGTNDAGDVRIFFVNQGTISLDSITLSNGRGQGGRGGNGAYAGGGGLGAGGALFINNGTVTVSNTTFTGNQAIGGSGGNYSASSFGFGGGGGFGGNGGDGIGSAGGGGGFSSNGGFGSSGGYSGGGGGFNGGGANSSTTSGGAGGSGIGSILGGSAATAGTGTNPGLGGGIGGGGGGSGNGGNGGNGGIGGGGGGGGGGGNGGGGGDFGGGGGNSGSNLGDSGNGGFGGGGGGYASHGGFGGGGGTRGYGPGTFGGNAPGNGAAGGGAGLGGAIFVRNGSLTLTSATFNNNVATGGTGGLGDGGSTFLNGSPGQGKGGAIFINTGSTAGYTNAPTYSGNSAANAGSGSTDNVNIYGTLSSINAAPALTVSGTPLSYTENDPATLLDSTATVADSDSPNFDTGTLTVSFSANGTTDDRLAIRNQGTSTGQISISGNAISYGGTQIGTLTGGTNGSTPLVITFNASATPTAVSALLQNLTYANVSENPATSPRTVQLVVTDGDGGTSTAVTKTINVTAVDDTQFFVTNTNDSGAGSLRQAILNANADPGTEDILFNLGQGSQTITLASVLPDLTDSVNILNTTGANNLTIDSNSPGAFEFFHVLSGVTATFDQLTLQHAFDGIFNDGTVAISNSLFKNNSSGSSGSGLSNSSTGTVTSISNSAFIANTQGIYNGGTITTISNSTFGNNNFYGIQNLNGRTITTISNSTFAANVFSGVFNNGTIANLFNTLLVGNGDNAVNGTITNQSNNLAGTFTDLGVDSVLKDNGGSTPTYALLAGSIAANAGDNTKLPQDTTDLDGDSNTTEPIPFDQRGTGFNRIVGSIVDVGAFESDILPNALPTSANNSVTTNEDTFYAFKATDFSFSDTDNGDTLQSVKITQLPTAGSLALNSNAVNANDVISITDITNGNLKFTPAANANGTNYASFQFKVGDGKGFSTSAYTMALNVTAVNDAPILSDTTVTLAAVNEDAGIPNGSVGTLVSTIVNSSNVTDADIPNGFIPGIAITAADTSNGTWLYSTDGTTWNSLGAVSDANARLLAATDRLYFQPNANYNGTISNAINFRAWDQTSGNSGGLGDTTGSNNGGSTAFSAATDTASLMVTAINDAPSFTKGTDQTIMANSGAQTVANWATGFNPGPADESGQTVQAYVVTVTSNPGIFAVAPTIDSSGTLTYTPVTNLATATTATLSVRVRDNGGTANGGVDTSAVQTFAITVQPQPTLSIGNVSQTEGNSGTTAYTFTVSLSNASAQTVAVNYTTADGTATVADGDYSAATGSLTFAPGETSKTITINVKGDPNQELDETFLVNLLNPTNATLVANATSGTGTILNDDRVNLLWRNNSATPSSETGKNAIWQMNGFTLESSYYLPTIPDSNWQIISTADFNNDGTADILWRNKATGENAIWQMNSTGLQNAYFITSVADSNWQIASTADFNKDGIADILWRNKATGENAIWQMNSTGLQNGYFITTVADSNWQIASTADFNKDGTADILWRNKATGENAIWQMNGFTLQSSRFITSAADSNWQVVGTADFNHDGIADLVWRNQATGQNAIWQMNSTDVQTGYYLTPVADLNWQIAGVADFNGDGSPDLLWRNSQAGKAGIWQMNGFTDSQTYLLSDVSSDWVVRPLPSPKASVPA